MSALRLPVLSAFAGGCLCSALLFGVWRAGESAGAAAAQQQQRARNAELVTAPVTTARVPTASSAPSAEPRPDLVAFDATAAEHDATAERAAAPVAQDPDSAGPTSAGSAAVSDVLTRLEAAYRERAAAIPAPSSTREQGGAALPVDRALEPAPPPRETAPEPVAAVIPDPAAAVVAPVAVAPVAVAPVAVAPVAVAAVAPPIAAAPAVGPEGPSPTEVHYGDVNQNTYITNVRQGDVYLIQMQQLAMLQYMQLLGVSAGVAAPARHGRAAAAQRTPFPSTLTNPDNPWGFKFAPLNLVH